MKTLHGSFDFPTFFPDATVGKVRGVETKDLEDCQVEGLVCSSFHLMVNGIFGDLHKIMGWDKTILTDSGGFQVFSLLRNNPNSGKVSSEGFLFDWNGVKINFTPEESIRKQMEYGADILICLDWCTDPSLDQRDQKQAVERTIEWALRCKKEFEKMTRKYDINNKPLLFAVIQGGNNKNLRKVCANELIKIDFDGYCFGGWPIDEKGKFLEEILEYTASLMPDDKPKYALGVGKPEDIIKCTKMGYGIFDCVIPTREARHKRLYVFEEGWKMEHVKNFYTTINVNSKFLGDSRPISKICDCFSCQNFSRDQILEFFKNKDEMAWKLSTIHNLRFYTKLLEYLKGLGN